MLVVIGGHTRNIGKTSVVAGLVAALREMRWTAVKVTQFGHGVCSANGEPCDCETADHTVAVSEERQRGTGTDSSRYLDAGAERAFWVRTRQGQLAEAMPRLRQLIAASANAGGHVIVESNSVLRFVQPDVLVSVLDPAVADFKPSALRYLDRADALLVAAGGELQSWPQVSAQLLASRPVFRFTPPEYCPMELVEFVRERLAGRAAAGQG